jgi:hypothetical protein
MAGRRSTLRASDEDREKIAERLRRAAHEGRLSTDELDDRLGAALKAKTYGELDDLMADLPGENVSTRDRGPALRQGALLMPIAAVGLVVVLATIAVLAIATIAFLGAAWLGWVIFAWAIFGHHPGRYMRRHSHRRYHPYTRTGAPGPGRHGRGGRYYGRSQPGGPGRSYWG